MAADPTTATRRLALAAALAAVAFGLVVAAILTGAGGPAGPGPAIGLVVDPDENPLLAPEAEPGTPVPADSYETLDGGTASLADYAGRPLVVNFFASWCPPCVAEMPGFESVHQRLRGEVAFVGLAVSDRRDDTADIVARTGVTYDIGRDPAAELHRQLGGFTMPSTAFVTADGRIVAVHNGELTVDALERLIEEHLR